MWLLHLRGEILRDFSTGLKLMLKLCPSRSSGTCVGVEVGGRTAKVTSAENADLSKVHPLKPAVDKNR